MRSPDRESSSWVRFLLFTKFVAGLGTVGPPLAGIVRVGVLRFAIYSATGAFLWVGVWMALGYGAGQAVDRVVTRAGQVGAILAVALAAVIVGSVVLTWLRRRRFLWSPRIARGPQSPLRRWREAAHRTRAKCPAESSITTRSRIGLI